MIKITHNLDHAIRDLTNKAKTIIPRAAVSAMNKCAYESQQAMRQDFRKQFKNRTPWSVSQIRYEKAKLSQWPRLKARVGTKFKAVRYQVEGGSKEATKPTWIGVPVGIKGNDMETRRGRMPAALLKKKSYKLIKYNNKYYVAYQKPLKKKRRGKKGQGTQEQRPRIKILYDMRKRIQFRPRWDFERIVVGVFDKQYEKRFNDAFYR